MRVNKFYLRAIKIYIFQIKILSKYLNKQIEIIPYKTNGEVVSALLRKEVHISILGNVSSNLTDNGVKVIGTSFKSKNYFDLSTIIPDFKYFKAQIGFIVTLKNKQSLIKPENRTSTKLYRNCYLS